MNKQNTGLLSRLKHGWNAFRNRDPTIEYRNIGPGYFTRPDKIRYSYDNEKSIINTIVTRIAVDVASIDFIHCKLDENGRFAQEMTSSLNDCLRVEANIDQTGRAFIQDVVMSMLDEGCVSIVPVTTDDDPQDGETYKVYEMRTAKILEWYPRHVKVHLYNDQTGRHEDMVFPKSMVAIIENPFYSIMNEKNSTMQRLKHKLSLLDISDEKTTSGKLDMIIQLPYVIKTEALRQQAEERRSKIEMQLSSSKYGIAYADGTEKITQLNRPVENNLLTQIEFLTKQVYSQLGLTDEILNGTADEQTMLNYNNRVIEPIASAIVKEFNRKFLTKTARTQRQTIHYVRDPFRLVPVNNLAEIADKFTRNEIMTSNEIRAIVGLKPSDEPKADMLVNSNIAQPSTSLDAQTTNDNTEPDGTGNAFSMTEEVRSMLDKQ